MPLARSSRRLSRYSKGGRVATELPPIGSPATSALAAIGVTTLEGVQAMSEKELLALHGVGPKAVRILKEALAERGLSLRS
jgi:hypothetical protein